MARVSHSPSCRATATNHNCPTRQFQRSFRSSMPKLMSNAAKSISQRLVLLSTSTTVSSTRLVVCGAILRMRPTAKRKEMRISR